MIGHMNPDQNVENFKATIDQLVLATCETRTIFSDIVTDNYLVLS